MPKLVIDPKCRYCWEANFNPALRMSNNAISSVMFKMELERARYNGIINRLDGEAKTELRISKRQIEQTKQELQELKAYQKVAELTAFKTFDPELKRREREREEMNLQRQLEQEEKRAAKEIEEYEEKERDGMRKRLERQRREKEKNLGNNYANMLLLSRKSGISDGASAGCDAELAEVQLRNRRLSSTGNAFVTLKDIMDNDDVLQRHSDGIMNARRLSQDHSSSSRRTSQDFTLSGLRPSHVELVSNSRRQSLLSLSSKRQGSNAISSSAPDLTHTSKPVLEHAKETDILSPGKEEKNSDKEHSSLALKCGFSRSGRRRSKIGSISSLVEQVIQEQKDCPANDDNTNGTGVENNDNVNLKWVMRMVGESYNSSNIFITDISKPNEDLNSDADPESRLNKHAANVSKTGDNLSEACVNTALGDLESEKAKCEAPDGSQTITPFKLQERDGLFEILNQLKRNKEMDEVIEEDDSEQESSDKVIKTQEKHIHKPGLLRGLARFKSMANIITENNREAKEKMGVAQIKKLTAAVVMANCAAQGKVPSAFMMHHLSPAIRSETKQRAPKLETVHKESGALKLRPLQMPLSVQRQHEKKFEELMATINGAVHWKVRALRENTGTLNPRQLRRKQREQAQEQYKHYQQEHENQHQQQHRVGDVKPRPAFNIRPRRQRMELPGACTTTWSLKRFVQKEVQELLASWQPENARKLRCQRLKSSQ